MLDDHSTLLFPDVDLTKVAIVAVGEDWYTCARGLFARERHANRRV